MLKKVRAGVIVFKSKKQKTRNPRVEYKKQQSYHYSSIRTGQDRAVGRRSVDIADEDMISKNRGLKVANLPTYIAFIILAVSVIYLLTLGTRPNIVVLNPTAKTQLINQDILKTKAQGVLESSILNRFKPTFNEEKISKNLLQFSPEITFVSIDLQPLRHNPNIMVEFSEPSAVLSNGRSLFVIGSNGKVLSDITSNKDGFKVDALPLVQDESGINIEVGKIALTSNQVKYLNEVSFQAKNANLNISSMILKSNGSELHVKYGSLEYLVKYSFYEDARKSSGVFLATKQKLEDEGSTPKEYIDVRVPERAYVK